MKRQVFVVLAVLVMWASSAYAKAWWQDAVFYEIFVRSFYDSDGDGIGDLKGVKQKLDYIQELGANALWLMPIFRSPSVHCYDTYDYYSIEENYGTVEDFESLLAASKRRGMRVVLDLMVNHNSSQHEWFTKSVQRIAPYDDYYIWRKKRPGGKWYVYGKEEPVLNGGWRYHDQRGQYFYAYFSERMPDLNLENKLVRQEFKAIAKYWLEKGVAGFRLDAAQNIIEKGPGHGRQYDSPSTIAWWVEFGESVREVNPEAVLIGEVWAEPETVANYYADGKGLNLCFSFPLQKAVLESLNLGDASKIVSTVEELKKAPAPFGFFAPFLSNHDQRRYFTTLNKDLSKARLAVVILLTSPGTPFIYYGEEIEMHQAELEGKHRSARTVMQWDETETTGGFTNAKQPWDKIGNNKNPYNVEYQRGVKDSLWRLYQKLIELRLSHPELRYGGYEFYCKGTGLLAYERSYGGEQVLVLMNPSGKELGVEDVRVHGRYKDLLTEKVVEVGGDLRLKNGEHYLLRKD